MRDVKAAAAKKDGAPGGAALKAPDSAKKDMMSGATFDEQEKSLAPGGAADASKTAGLKCGRGQQPYGDNAKYGWNVTFTKPNVDGDDKTAKRTTQTIDAVMKTVTLGSDGSVIMMEGEKISTVKGGVDKGTDSVLINPDVPGNLGLYQAEVDRVANNPQLKLVRSKAPSADLKTEVAWCG